MVVQAPTSGSIARDGYRGQSSCGNQWPMGPKVSLVIQSNEPEVKLHLEVKSFMKSCAISVNECVEHVTPMINISQEA